MCRLLYGLHTRRQHSRGQAGLNRMQKLRYAALLQLAVFMLLAQHAPAQAGEAAGTSDNKDVKRAEITVEKVFNLGEVVVEGEAETVTQVATVDTISKKKIKETTSQNVADALTTAPGVTLTIGRRNERTFNIRGFNQRYIPVFLDGIPISIPFDGYVDAGKIPTSGISKITVSKGISSVLYGFNTMGGVVNIVTRKPQIRPEPRLAPGEILFHPEYRVSGLGGLSPAPLLSAPVK
jgi:outer membrane cobalamin receptor